MNLLNLIKSNENKNNANEIESISINFKLKSECGELRAMIKLNKEMVGRMVIVNAINHIIGLI